MVQLRFTKLIDKVLNHQKTQTIRVVTPNRKKNPLRKGQTLQVYLLFKIGEAVITQVERKKFYEISNQDAIKDGFSNIHELTEALLNLHNFDLEDPNIINKEFDIISFHPNWKPQALVVLKTLKEIDIEIADLLKSPYENNSYELNQILLKIRELTGD